MEQRMSQLQREQSFLIEEMKKLVDHRDIIRTKGKVIQNAAQSGKLGTTRLSVEKENDRLFKELNAKRQEAQNKEKLIKDSLVDVDRTATEVDRTQKEIESLDSQLESLQSQLLMIQKERERAEDEKKLKQNSLQRLRDGEKGSYKLTCYPEDAETETTRLNEGRRTVVSIMEELSNQFPDLSIELQDLMSVV